MKLICKMEHEEILNKVYNEIKKENIENYVPKGSTKYSTLETKYYKLSKVIKNPESLKKWMSLKAGRKDGKINPKEAYSVCEEDPVAYLAFMRGIFLMPHQIKAMEKMKDDNIKYFALCWGRRLGKTYVFRTFAEWSCLFNKHPVEGKGTKWSILMHSKDIGKEVYMEEVYQELEKGNFVVRENFKGALGDEFFSNFLIKREDKTGQATGMKMSYRILEDMSYDNVKRFISGEKMYRITSSFKIMTKTRGIEGNVICDEISFWKENPHLRNTKDIYDKGVRPIVTSDPKLKCFISSTPDGFDNIFFDLFDPLDKFKTSPFERLWFPCWVKQDKAHLLQMESLKKEYIEKGELYVFQQEYEAKFVKSKDAFFDEDLHISKFQDDKISYVTSSDEPCVIIADWGGTNTSHTVLSVVSYPTDKYPARVLYKHEYPVNEDNTVVQDILDLTYRFKAWDKFICDNKGGNFAVKDLERILGEWKVEQFNFRTQKQDGYFAMKQSIRNNEFKCPPDKRVEEQLRNFTDKLKPNDSMVSDDIIDTFMMGIFYISQKDKEIYEVISIDKGSRDQISRKRTPEGYQPVGWESIGNRY